MKRKSMEVDKGMVCVVEVVVGVTAAWDGDGRTVVYEERGRSTGGALGEGGVQELLKRRNKPQEEEGHEPASRPRSRSTNCRSRKVQNRRKAGGLENTGRSISEPLKRNHGPLVGSRCNINDEKHGHLAAESPTWSPINRGNGGSPLVETKPRHKHPGKGKI
ncbi:hypothetical protein HAX54_047762 [Datura stramonium]|uniref:Uncharacterized protein n=1 Tax=Datura stramonium TaxID=4076 RepID=A0ABS8WIM5_DATST|nr:hypothetical protein [Datura stramonium]